MVQKGRALCPKQKERKTYLMFWMLLVSKEECEKMKKKYDDEVD